MCLAAFYLGIENDVLGIGDPSGEGTPLFNSRREMGIAGDNVEGFIMMWNVHASWWDPGTGPEADFTRLALAQDGWARISDPTLRSDVLKAYGFVAPEGPPHPDNVVVFSN